MTEVLYLATIAAQRDDWNHAWVAIALVSLLGVVVFLFLGFLVDLEEELLVGGVGVSCLVLLFSVAMQIHNFSQHTDEVAETIEQNVLENFAVEKVTVEDGMGEFMGGEEKGPAVFTVQFDHADAKPTKHQMVYDEHYDIIVPIHDEAEAITPYIQEGSPLDVLLTE